LLVYPGRVVPSGLLLPKKLEPGTYVPGYALEQPNWEVSGLDSPKVNDSVESLTPLGREPHVQNLPVITRSRFTSDCSLMFFHPHDRHVLHDRRVIDQ